MSRILVPVDFSAQSIQAVRFAAAYAKDKHDLTLLHVIQPFPSRYVVNKLGKEGVEKIQLDEAKEDLKPLVEIIEAAGIAYQLEIVFGNAHEEIAKHAKGEYAAVVMGTRGYGRMTGFLKQSVSYPTIHDSKIPVFLISEETDAADFPWRNVLLTVDGSDQAMAAVNKVIGLSEGMDVSFTLLTVVTPPVAYTGMYGVGWEDTATLEEWGRETLRPYEELLDERQVPFESKVLIGDPAMLIRETAQEKEASLIALGHHGLGGIAGTLVGSVTFKTIHRAKTPLLIVKS
ncbi:universal stress protein [Brevibacillus choshinensis]|uniref:Universal stress protein n=1 Tax=Brevibacillus choshinensis TaxID=54911 RepID=A0ABX7FVP4_BRECH|nr:universal stress protein [Brevibacillus choshinensis]QRG69687.1 universal stress protein [Brevibacillus choshinensis]